MGPGDLSGKGEVVVRDVSLWVLGAVLELNFKAATELLKIDLRPVYLQRRADVARLLSAYPTLIGHAFPPCLCA